MTSSVRARTARSLLPGTANKVRLIVEETFGPGYWDGFQRYMAEDAGGFGHEWRFGGALGFGGKVHLSGGKLYVSCYRKDETPIIRAALRWVNGELATALAEMPAVEGGGCHMRSGVHEQDRHHEDTPRWYAWCECGSGR